MKILFVEDDEMLGKAIHIGLKTEHTVDWVSSAEDAELGMETGHYDLVILDINLPGMSGLVLLQNIRRRGNKIPVLLLTARETASQRVEGLDAGADDYLVKPFDFDELLARIRALSRRGQAYNDCYISHGDIEEKIYGWDELIESNTIEVHISALRRKLGKNLIKTTRGVGYVVEKAENCTK